MMVPDWLRDEVTSRLWEEAERLNWHTLPPSSKSKYYTMWTETEAIGGRLAGFMDARQVRVYIKDTLLKAYTRERYADPSPAMKSLGLASDSPVSVSYIKPHGRLLRDGRQIAWSRATEWKATLMALHERSLEQGGQPYGVVLFEAATKHSDAESRVVVDSAAQKLGIERVVWVD
jgi:hypothetical protein